MNTFTILGKLIDVEVIFSSRTGRNAARVMLETYYQGEKRGIFPVALFRNNADLAIAGFKKDAWALITGTMEAETRENANGIIFYNVRLTGKTIELIDGEHPTIITAPEVRSEEVSAADAETDARVNAAVKSDAGKTDL